MPVQDYIDTLKKLSTPQHLPEALEKYRAAAVELGATDYDLNIIDNELTKAKLAVSNNNNTR